MTGGHLDAVVVGSGPNGLTAAAVLARAGRSVLVVEAADHPGGGAATQELTEPGFHHDVGSSVHPLAVASPAFEELDLTGAGLRWLQPDVCAAHPFDDRPAAALCRDPAATRAGLGADARRWRLLHGVVEDHWPALRPTIFEPLLPLPHLSVTAVRFGVPALAPAAWLGRVLREPAARGLFAGVAAHSVLPFHHVASAAFGVLLGGLAGAVGWPVPEGGAGAITAALTDRLEAAGGRIETGRPIHSAAELPRATVTLFDTSARLLARVGGEALPDHYRRRLEGQDPGPGLCKVDWALDGPIPWRDEACRRSPTVHVGGTYEEVAAAELSAHHGHHTDRPFVLLTQPSVIDPSRAPGTGQVAWGYCHVPTGSALDLSGRIEAQVERFAPGFRDRIRARVVSTAPRLQRMNPSLVGGAITGGTHRGLGLLRRPVLTLAPWATPIPGWYLCSSATPPGAAVHGMAGWHAAHLALRRELR